MDWKIEFETNWHHFGYDWVETHNTNQCVPIIYLCKIKEQLRERFQGCYYTIVVTDIHMDDTFFSHEYDYRRNGVEILTYDISTAMEMIDEIKIKIIRP